MRRVAVIEMPDEKIAREITGRAEEIFENGGYDPLFITRGKNFAMLGGMAPEILILSPGYAEKTKPDSRPVKCRVLLTPGSAADEKIEAACAVGYGMSGCNSITLSSIKEDECILTLQRDILTLGGCVLERQDIAVRKDKATDPEELMAAAAALLILGIPPEKIV